MREEVKQAIAGYYVGTRHEHWYGKTYRQFWEWFGAQDNAIAAMACDETELAEIRDALTDVVADADDAGYAIEPESLDRLIQQSAPLEAPEEMPAAPPERGPR